MHVTVCYLQQTAAKYDHLSQLGFHRHLGKNLTKRSQFFLLIQSMHICNQASCQQSIKTTHENNGVHNSNDLN